MSENTNPEPEESAEVEAHGADDVLDLQKLTAAQIKKGDQVAFSCSSCGANSCRANE